MRRALRAVLAAAALFFTTGQSAPQDRLLDGFEVIAPWEALASDGVQSAKSSVAGRTGKAMRLAFDFADVSGYAFARRELPIEFPENFEVSFWMRADAPVNTLEVKFVDASGDNVWWRQRRDVEFPREWTQVRLKRRQIDFAWGPTEDKTLRRTAKMEFVVVRGRGGGKGWIEIDDLRIRELPPEPATPPRPLARASSSDPGEGPERAVDGVNQLAWRTKAPRAQLTLDLGYEREFGGLDLHWSGSGHASDYDVLLSDDGRSWRTAFRMRGGTGARDPLRLPESAARYVRLDLLRGTGRGYALAEVEVEPLAFGDTPTSFIEAVARDASRGRYPRGFYEQPYWTLVGVDGGADSGLISEDGAVEIGKGGISVEPAVIAGPQLFTWADVAVSQSLQDGYVPIPTVTWTTPGWRLDTTAFAEGTPANNRLVTRYTVTNRLDRPQTVTLALAVRPFQVNGPRQFLTTPGGVSPIRELRWSDGALVVNGDQRVTPLTAPDAFTASAFHAGELPDLLQDTSAPRLSQVRDETGLASGAFTYALRLPPGGSQTVGWVAPLTGSPPAIGRVISASNWLAEHQAAVANAWRAKLDRVGFTVPAEGRRLSDTLKTSLAHILMSRNGPVLQPGTRSYDRSWIRDGAMIAESLVRLGNAEIAADYLRWYAPKSFANGKVPCCVDSRGADPTPENDSHGELIFLAAEVHRYTGDDALLRSVWPQVEGAVRYMDELRASETAKNAAPERRHLFGLLPPSISHEGYSSKPAYSHWDNFWGLLGYKDAVYIADALGEREAAARFAASRDAFRRDVLNSLNATRRVHGIGFIPGAADLGDFDATSTTIALAPGGEQPHLPPELLRSTFERYWTNFVRRRDGAEAWEAYTPYELRTVGTFVRLGWRERAHSLLDFFFADRRPQAWNGWAEVVAREPRKPTFIGDMPHAWVSSDYIRSALDMLAYDREADRTLVLAHGVPESWMRDPGGVGVRDLRTPYGPLTYSLRPSGRDLRLTIGAGAQPPGGYVLPWWGEGAPPRATQNGRALPWRGGELRVPGAGEVLIRR